MRPHLQALAVRAPRSGRVLDRRPGVQDGESGLQSVAVYRHGQVLMSPLLEGLLLNLDEVF